MIITFYYNAHAVAWKSWENYVRKKAMDKGDIYVITGTTSGTETYAIIYYVVIFLIVIRTGCLMVLLYQLLGTSFLFGVKMESFKLSTSIPNMRMNMM